MEVLGGAQHMPEGLGLLPCSDCLVWHKVIAVSRAMLEFQSFVGWGAKPLSHL